MGKYANGFYQPTNPGKYVGKKNPHYRSSWENTFMIFCDTNPAVINWASEPFMVPYRNPFTGRNTIYVPDFLILKDDKYPLKNINYFILANFDKYDLFELANKCLYLWEDFLRQNSLLK